MDANKIEKARLRKGLSQEELAKTVNVHPEVIKSWEKAESLPSPEMRKALSKELDIRLSGLTPMQKSIRDLLLVSAVHLFMYLVSYGIPMSVGFYPPLNSTQWLYGVVPIFLYPYLVTAVPAFFGYTRYSAVSCGGLLLGMLLGELFGKPKITGPDDVTWLHYGWAIWLCTFIVSIIVGIIVEVLSRKRKRG